jgi:hypothetical protein
VCLRNENCVTILVSLFITVSQGVVRLIVYGASTRDRQLKPRTATAQRAMQPRRLSAHPYTCVTGPYAVAICLSTLQLQSPDAWRHR